MPDIPISEIEIGKSQARNRKVREDLEDLVESIRKVGQLQPVSVYKNEHGKYELLLGQRRFLALKELGHTTIKAEIVDPPKSPLEAKMRSLTENIVRKGMIDQDTIDAITEAFRHYGTFKRTSEETGLREDILRKWVNFDALPNIVQDAVKDSQVSMKNAFKAAKALKWDSGEVEKDEKVLELAQEIEKLESGAEKDQAVKIALADPGQSVEEIVKKAKNPKNIVKEVKIKLFSEDFEKLSTYSETEEETIEDAAAGLVKEGLQSKGY